MRQVPRFLIIGNGRLATHFKHYFSLLCLEYDTWQRSESIQDLNSKITHASHILLMIKDDAIEPFIHTYLTNRKHSIFVHFSGGLVTPLAYGAHPLMTFAKDLYDLPLYQSIPFLLDENAPALSELLPGLPNVAARLKLADKAKYHAICVLAGNFSCLLWQKLFATLSDEFHLDKKLAHPYLMQQMHNILNNTKEAFTGPLSRDDKKTLAKNMMALQNDPFQDIYQSFVSCYQNMKRGV